MPAYLNPVDIAKIGVIAFAFVFIANRALAAAGVPQFATN